VLEVGGLRVRARCGSGGALSVEAVASNSTGGVVHVTAGSGSATATAADNDLRAADIVNVIPAGADNASGTLSWYSPAGDTITVDYLAQDGLGAARGYQCLFAGTAIHATP
jgi:hypothetical protein